MKRKRTFNERMVGKKGVEIKVHVQQGFRKVPETRCMKQRYTSKELCIERNRTT